MDNTLATYFPRSGPIAFMGQNRQVTGAGISFFIHVVGVCFIVFFSSNISSFNSPMVIDFSIEESFGEAKPQKVVVQKKNPPVPEVKKVVAVREPLPKKPKVVVIKKIIPIVTKTKVAVEEKEPEVVETAVVPEFPEEAKVVEEEIEETVPAQIVASEEFSIPNDPPAAGPIVTQSPIKKKERYFKEHFHYIKESVQNKIAYPRMARKMGWQGRVLLSFVVCMDGSVKDIRILESSGFNALDKNAVEAIRKGAPFPRPPVAAELIIPVIYKLS
jgi:protein TonB